MFNVLSDFKSSWSVEKPGFHDVNGYLLIVRSGGDFLVPDEHLSNQNTRGGEYLFARPHPMIQYPDNWTVCRIGELDGTPVTLVMAPADTAPDTGFTWNNPRPYLADLDPGRIEAISRASMLATWDNDHRFCGRCGEPTIIDEREPARVCSKCAHRSYPRVSPAMIVRIIAAEDNGFDKPHILLAHNRHFPEGLYSCVAGFVDPGESVERTVLREIKEEVNLEAREPTYIKSQAWPFPHSLMLGFEATASGLPVPDGEEIAEAAWFGFDDLPEIPRRGTIARYLIDGWLDKCR